MTTNNRKDRFSTLSSHGLSLTEGLPKTILAWRSTTDPRAHMGLLNHSIIVLDAVLDPRSLKRQPITRPQDPLLQLSRRREPSSMFDYEGPATITAIWSFRYLGSCMPPCIYIYILYIPVHLYTCIYIYILKKKHALHTCVCI